jgi:O-antigen/teichoic acid export membrane protein
MNTFRYYSDVQFRLIINYKKYFLYYLLLSFGYCSGSLILKNWSFVFLLGETLAVMYVVLKGNILTKQLAVSEFKFKVLKSSTTLSLSYLLFNTILFIDRIILLNLVDSQAVSQYYVASLLGKTLAIITGPLNTIILSYLTKDKKVIDKKQYLKIITIVTLISAVFFSMCWLATPLFVKIFYPNLFESARQLAAAASLAQVLCFSSTIFLAVVLTFASEKHQFAVQFLFAIAFIGLAIPMTKASGVFGFAKAAVFANLFRFLLVCILGYIKAPRAGKSRQNLVQ